jgi:replicative DNA helicase
MESKQIPHSQELEESILGALMLEPSLCNTIIPILKPEYFYTQANNYIFNAILDLYTHRNPIDILTVIQKLNALKTLEIVGGAYFVSSLTNKVPSSANIEFHARMIQQKYLVRRMIVIANDLTVKCYEPKADPFEIIEGVEKQISELTNFFKVGTKSIGQLLTDVIDDIKKVQEHGIATGLLSGFENIDSLTGGWQNGTLNILAARPAMGKTAFALSLAKNSAINKKPSLIFSLEMTAKQLAGRLAASESEVSSSKINQKRITVNELGIIGAKCSQLMNAPLYIDDTPNLTFNQLRSIALRLKHELKIEFIIIDYLQLMHGELKGNRESEISFISRNLKGLSKELDLPIIALSQLSRKVEERTDKRPQLSDLRESGAIEQDADNVMFLFRPEYYDLFPNGYEYGTTVLDTKNLCLLDFAKGREIAVCEIPLKFYGEFMKFENYNITAPQVYVDYKGLAANEDFLI